MNEGRRLRLGSVARIFDGPHATPVKTNAGPWYLNIGSLQAGRLDLQESFHLSESDFPRWTRRVQPRPGDVLFSYETRLGEAALMPSGITACLGRRMGLLRVHLELVDPRFLLYTYLGPDFQETIRRLSVHGATVDRIPISEMGDWEVSLPPLPEQRAIAEVLGALDDKIEANRRIEDRSRLLMDALFTCLQETPPEAEIPLMSVVEFVFGEPFDSAFFNGDRFGRPLIRIRDLKTFMPQFFSTESRSKETVVQPGEVLVGMDAEFRPTIWCGEPGLLNQRVCLARPRVGSLAFIAKLLEGPLAEVESFKTGTTVSHLNKSDLEQIRVAVPETQNVARFDGAAEPLRLHIVVLHQENRSLIQLRDAVLPKLLSGELRVRDADELVGEAV